MHHCESISCNQIAWPEVIPPVPYVAAFAITCALCVVILAHRSLSFRPRRVPVFVAFWLAKLSTKNGISLLAPALAALIWLVFLAPIVLAFLYGPYLFDVLKPSYAHVREPRMIAFGAVVVLVAIMLLVFALWRWVLSSWYMSTTSSSLILVAAILMLSIQLFYYIVSYGSKETLSPFYGVCSFFLTTSFVPLVIVTYLDYDYALQFESAGFVKAFVSAQRRDTSASQSLFNVTLSPLVREDHPLLQQLCGHFRGEAKDWNYVMCKAGAQCRIVGELQQQGNRVWVFKKKGRVLVAAAVTPESSMPPRTGWKRVMPGAHVLSGPAVPIEVLPVNGDVFEAERAANQSHKPKKAFAVSMICYVASFLVLLIFALYVEHSEALKVPWFMGWTVLGILAALEVVHWLRRKSGLTLHPTTVSLVNLLARVALLEAGKEYMFLGLALVYILFALLLGVHYVRSRFPLKGRKFVVSAELKKRLPALHGKLAEFANSKGGQTGDYQPRADFLVLAPLDWFGKRVFRRRHKMIKKHLTFVSSHPISPFLALTAGFAVSTYAAFHFRNERVSANIGDGKQWLLPRLSLFDRKVYHHQYEFGIGGCCFCLWVMLLTYFRRTLRYYGLKARSHLPPWAVVWRLLMVLSGCGICTFVVFRVTASHVLRSLGYSAPIVLTCGELFLTVWRMNDFRWRKVCQGKQEEDGVREEKSSKRKIFKKQRKLDFFMLFLALFQQLSLFGMLAYLTVFEDTDWEGVLVAAVAELALCTSFAVRKYFNRFSFSWLLFFAALACAGVIAAIFRIFLAVSWGKLAGGSLMLLMAATQLSGLIRWKACSWALSFPRNTWLVRTLRGSSMIMTAGAAGSLLDEYFFQGTSSTVFLVSMLLALSILFYTIALNIAISASLKQWVVTRRLRFIMYPLLFVVILAGVAIIKVRGLGRFDSFSVFSTIAVGACLVRGLPHFLAQDVHYSRRIFPVFKYDRRTRYVQMHNSYLLFVYCGMTMAIVWSTVALLAKEAVMAHASGAVFGICWVLLTMLTLHCSTSTRRRFQLAWERFKGDAAVIDQFRKEVCQSFHISQKQADLTFYSVKEMTGIVPQLLNLYLCSCCRSSTPAGRLRVATRTTGCCCCRKTVRIPDEYPRYFIISHGPREYNGIYVMQKESATKGSQYVRVTSESENAQPELALAFDEGRPKWRILSSKGAEFACSQAEGPASPAGTPTHAGQWIYPTTASCWSFSHRRDASMYAAMRVRPPVMNSWQDMMDSYASFVDWEKTRIDMFARDEAINALFQSLMCSAAEKADVTIEDVVWQFFVYCLHDRHSAAERTSLNPSTIVSDSPAAVPALAKEVSLVDGYNIHADDEFELANEILRLPAAGIRRYVRRVIKHQQSKPHKCPDWTCPIFEKRLHPFKEQSKRIDEARKEELKNVRKIVAERSVTTAERMRNFADGCYSEAGRGEQMFPTVETLSSSQKDAIRSRVEGMAYQPTAGYTYVWDEENTGVQAIAMPPDYERKDLVAASRKERAVRLEFQGGHSRLHENLDLQYQLSMEPSAVLVKGMNTSEADPLGVGYGDFQFTDVQQGFLGDCWLISAMAVLAKVNPKKIQNLFVWSNRMKHNSEQRCHIVRLFSAVRQCWEVVLVEDTFPGYTLPHTTAPKPLFAQLVDPHRRTWPLVLEKAFARYLRDHRGYWALRGGLASEALVALTGGCCEEFFLDDPKYQVADNLDVLFERMLGWAREEHFIGAGSFSSEERKRRRRGPADVPFDDAGIFDGHAYGVLAVKRCQLNSTEEHRMVQLFNPYGRNFPPRLKTVLDWYPTSPLWEGEGGTRMAKLLKYYPRERRSGKRRRNEPEPDPGTFWMTFSDFVKRFQSVFVCRMLSDWRRVRTYGRWDGNPTSLAGGFDHMDKNPQFSLVLRKKTTLFISLTQECGTVGDLPPSIAAMIFKNSVSKNLLPARHVGPVTTLPDIVCTPVVNKLQTSVEISKLAKGSYTVLCAAADTGARNGFTLEVFAKTAESAPTLTVAARPEWPRIKISGQRWPSRLSGGWWRLGEEGMLNPQYRIEINRPSAVWVVMRQVKAAEEEAIAAAMVLFSFSLEPGLPLPCERFNQLQQHHVVAETGGGECKADEEIVLQVVALPKGAYTLLCCTEDRDTKAGFDLTFYCLDPVVSIKVEPLQQVRTLTPPPPSGRAISKELSVEMRPADFRVETENPLARQMRSNM